MDSFVKGVAQLSRLCGYLAAAFLLAAVLVVCHLVFVRYVLNASAIWQHEFVTYSLIASTLLGSPYVLLQRGHVNVDLLPHYLGRRGRRVLELVAAAGGLAFVVILAVQGWLWWHEAWAGGWHAETVWAPPLWIPYLALPLGMGLLALQYLADILAVASGGSSPFIDEAPEAGGAGEGD